jgi:hypothetical protein
MLPRNGPRTDALEHTRSKSDMRCQGGCKPSDQECECTCKGNVILGDEAEEKHNEVTLSVEEGAVMCAGRMVVRGHAEFDMHIHVMVCISYFF